MTYFLKIIIAMANYLFHMVHNSQDYYEYLTWEHYLLDLMKIPHQFINAMMIPHSHPQMTLNPDLHPFPAIYY